MTLNPSFLSTLERSRVLRQTLTKEAGLDWSEARIGSMRLGSHVAQVRLEPSDILRVELHLSRPADVGAALHLNGTLPGNVRIALGTAGLLVAADTLVDGQAHLPQTFRAIREGLSAAIGKPPEGSHATTSTSAALSPDAVQGVIDALDWPSDSVVRHENSWELRAHTDGETIPVRVGVEGADVVLRRMVLNDLGPDRAPTVVAHEALQINARLRHARLARIDDTVVAEARLHAGQLTPHWISLTAWAVASAYRLALPVLSVLARQPSVHDCYASLFSIGPDAVR